MDDVFDATNYNSGTAYLVEEGVSGSGTDHYTGTGQIQLQIDTSQTLSSMGVIVAGCDWTIQVSQP